MTCRELAKLTQPAHGDFLDRKQRIAFDRLLAAERVANAAPRHPRTLQERLLHRNAKAGLKDAVAVCEEWNALGAEC